MLKKYCKKVSKNIDFLMAWTLLIEAGACTRARFSTFQPATENHQKSTPKTFTFGAKIDPKKVNLGGEVDKEFIKNVCQK